MITEKKKRMANRMNPTAQAMKLGDELPIIAYKTLAEGDITSNKATIKIGRSFNAIASVLIMKADGSSRAWTKAEKTAGNDVEVTASSLGTGETVCVTVI